MPVNIRLKDPKRPDVAGPTGKTSSTTQLSTKKKATAMRRTLSKSALNNRIERRNTLSKRQTRRGGIARTNDRIYRILTISPAAERFLREEITISSKIDPDENVVINIFNEDKFPIIVNMKSIHSESLFRSEKKEINEIVFKKPNYI
jgi:hypothetical protein